MQTHSEVSGGTGRGSFVGGTGRSAPFLALAALVTAAAGLGGCDEGGGTGPDDGAADWSAEADGDAPDDPGADASTDVLPESDLDDAAGEADAPGPVCEVNNGVAPDLELAGAGASLVEYRAYMGTEAPYEVLRVQISGDHVGSVVPGVYELAGTTFEDCEVCVSILTGCNSGPCARFFYPVAGSVEILAIGGEGERFAGRLRGIEMAEFEILDSGIATEPLPDGDDWCIPDYTFDRTTTGSHEAVCGRPTVPCLGETVLDFSLQSCATGEWVSMSSLAAGNRALVYTMVTGWCPYCGDWMTAMVGYQETYGDAGLRVAYVYGEDAAEGSPDAAECLAYAAGHGADGADFYLDHDGSYSFTTTTYAMWPWVEAAESMGLPWTTILDAQTYEYVFTSENSPPLDFETVLLGLLEG